MGQAKKAIETEAQIYRRNAGFEFIIPLPLSLKTAKELLRSTERNFDDVSCYFRFNGRTMGHVLRSINISGKTYDAHIFTDFERRTEETNTLLRKLEIVEERLAGMKFNTEEETMLFIDSVADGMSKLFTVEKTAKQLKITRNKNAINEYVLKFGKIILLPGEP